MQKQIPRDFIDDLIARSDIIELIEERIHLKKAGTNYLANCPFHQEKTPSFTVSAQKQFYYCFGCGAHGNILGFLMAHDRLEFTPAVEYLAQRLGVTIPTQVQSTTKPHTDLYSLMEKSATFYREQLSKSPVASQYLLKRGLNRAIVDRYNIGYAPVKWDNLVQLFSTKDPQTQKQLLTAGMIIKGKDQQFYDRFRNRIMFPIRDTRGRVIAFGGRTLTDEIPKYLNSPETPIFHKSSELFGLYEAKLACQHFDKILIVEGYMDVIALAQHDINYAVATLGTATSAKHIQKLLRQCQYLIFCFDGDKAGLNAAWRALEISLPFMHDGVQIRFMFLPQSEDPDTVIRQKGKEHFETLIHEAHSLSDYLLKHLCEQTDLATLDGKAKLAKLAEPYFSKVPAGIFKQLLQDRLTKLIGTNLNFYPSLNDQEGLSGPDPRSMQPTHFLNPVQWVIAILLQHPNLRPLIELPKEIQLAEIPGLSLLQKLLDLLSTNPHLNAGGVLEYCREQQESVELAKLASWNLVVPENGLEQELRGAVQKIIVWFREQRISFLMQKANQAPLSAGEKQELMTLIAQQKHTHPI